MCALPSRRGCLEERIADELLVKLGIQVSPRTVRKHMQQGPSYAQTYCINDG